MTEQQEAFEAWLLARGYNNYKNRCGEYTNPHIAMWWTIWQAASDEVVLPVAWHAIKKAALADESFAWSIHCNLAMPMRDRGVNPRLANECAADLMQHVFGVPMTLNPSYVQWMSDEEKHGGLE